MSFTIWHNPRCTKSRKTLALLEENHLVKGKVSKMIHPNQQVSHLEQSPDLLYFFLFCPHFFSLLFFLAGILSFDGVIKFYRPDSHLVLLSYRSCEIDIGGILNFL